MDSVLYSLNDGTGASADVRWPTLTYKMLQAESPQALQGMNLGEPRLPGQKVRIAEKSGISLKEVPTRQICISTQYFLYETG